MMIKCHSGSVAPAFKPFRVRALFVFGIIAILINAYTHNGLMLQNPHTYNPQLALVGAHHSTRCQWMNEYTHPSTTLHPPNPYRPSTRRGAKVSSAWHARAYVSNRIRRPRRVATQAKRHAYIRADRERESPSPQFDLCELLLLLFCEAARARLRHEYEIQLQVFNKTLGLALLCVLLFQLR